MAAAAQKGTDLRGIDPGAGSQGNFHPAVLQLPQGHAAVGALHQGSQTGQLLHVGLRGLVIQAQGQGDLHDDHPVVVIILRPLRHPGLHSQTGAALGAEQGLIHRAASMPQSIRAAAMRWVRAVVLE